MFLFDQMCLDFNSHLDNVNINPRETVVALVVDDIAVVVVWPSQTNNCFATLFPYWSYDHFKS